MYYSTLFEMEGSHRHGWLADWLLAFRLVLTEHYCWMSTRQQQLENACVSDFFLLFFNLEHVLFTTGWKKSSSLLCSGLVTWQYDSLLRRGFQTFANDQTCLTDDEEEDGDDDDDENDEGKDTKRNEKAERTPQQQIVECTVTALKRLSIRAWSLGEWTSYRVLVWYYIVVLIVVKKDGGGAVMRQLSGDGQKKALLPNLRLFSVAKKGSTGRFWNQNLPPWALFWLIVSTALKFLFSY